MAKTGKGLELGAPEANAPEVTSELVSQMLKKIQQLEADKNALIDERDKRNTPRDDNKSANESRASTKARYRIIVEEGRDKHSPTHVFVGVNGRGYNIRRGVEVDVPPEVIENLKDAVEVTQVAVVDPERDVVTGTQERRVRRFPFQVLGKSRDEKGNQLMEPGAATLDGARMQ